MESKIPVARKIRKIGSCNICRHNFTADDIRSLPCGHTFHCGCIQQALMYSSRCPNCREVVYDSEDIMKLYIATPEPSTVEESNTTLIRADPAKKGEEEQQHWAQTNWIWIKLWLITNSRRVKLPLRIALFLLGSASLWYLIRPGGPLIRLTNRLWGKLYISMVAVGNKMFRGFLGLKRLEGTQQM